MVARGAYFLYIVVSSDIAIQIGALGILVFPHGNYVYIGSALNSLEPRITRHILTSLGHTRTTHWHIDYLLREPTVDIEAIYYAESFDKRECLYASQVAKHGEPVEGFGCSDCKCTSHLFRVQNDSFIEKMGLKKWAKSSLQLPV